MAVLAVRNSREKKGIHAKNGSSQSDASPGSNPVRPVLGWTGREGGGSGMETERQSKRFACGKHVGKGEFLGLFSGIPERTNRVGELKIGPINADDF